MFGPIRFQSLEDTTYLSGKWFLSLVLTFLRTSFTVWNVTWRLWRVVLHALWVSCGRWYLYFKLCTWTQGVSRSRGVLTSGVLRCCKGTPYVALHVLRNVFLPAFLFQSTKFGAAFLLLFQDLISAVAGTITRLRLSTFAQNCIITNKIKMLAILTSFIFVFPQPHIDLKHEETGRTRFHLSFYAVRAKNT